MVAEPVGEHIAAVGRVQSRNYQKKLPDETIVTRTAYEVSISKLSVIDDSVLNGAVTAQAQS